MQSDDKHGHPHQSLTGVFFLGTHHPAAVHGPLRALPALRLRLRHFTDGKNDPCGSWALFPPVRCRTHACTPTTGAHQPDADTQMEIDGGDTRSLLMAGVLYKEENDPFRRNTVAGFWWTLLHFPPSSRCVPLFPEQDRVAGRTDPQQFPLHPSPRGESPSAPPEGREGGSSVFRRALTCEEDSEREPTAKQVVTHRLTINYSAASVVQKNICVTLWWCEVNDERRFHASECCFYSLTDIWFRYMIRQFGLIF